MSTSTVAVTTSGVAAALVLVGLTLGLAGEAADQSAHAQPPEIAASASIDPSAAPSAEAVQVPVQLAAAEKPAAKSGRKSPSPSAEEKIEEALREPATLEFLDTPLQDVIDGIAETHRLKILIDQRALDDVAIPSDSPITFSLSDVSLQSGLNLMLRELDLTWTIRDEVLLITTPEEAEMMLVAKVYDVGDLVTCQDRSGELWADYDSLIEVITNTIEVASWEDVGGAGSITPAPFRGAKMLVVAQTCEIHQQIDQLLEQLRTIAQEKGSDEPPQREKPPGGSMHGMMGSEALLGAGMGVPGVPPQPADQSQSGVPGVPSTGSPARPPAGAAPPASDPNPNQLQVQPPEGGPPDSTGTVSPLFQPRQSPRSPRGSAY